MNFSDFKKIGFNGLKKNNFSGLQKKLERICERLRIVR